MKVTLRGARIDSDTRDLSERWSLLCVAAAVVREGQGDSAQQQDLLIIRSVQHHGAHNIGFQQEFAEW